MEQATSGVGPRKDETMARSPIEIMIDSCDLRCTICGVGRGGCDCWTKCLKPGCKWSYRKGTACNNPEHNAEER